MRWLGIVFLLEMMVVSIHAQDFALEVTPFSELPDVSIVVEDLIELSNNDEILISITMSQYLFNPITNTRLLRLNNEGAIISQQDFPGYRFSRFTSNSTEQFAIGTHYLNPFQSVLVAAKVDSEGGLEQIVTISDTLESVQFHDLTLVSSGIAVLYSHIENQSGLPTYELCIAELDWELNVLRDHCTNQFPDLYTWNPINPNLYRIIHDADGNFKVIGNDVCTWLYDDLSSSDCDGHELLFDELGQKVGVYLGRSIQSNQGVELFSLSEPISQGSSNLASNITLFTRDSSSELTPVYSFGDQNVFNAPVLQGLIDTGFGYFIAANCNTHWYPYQENDWPTNVLLHQLNYDFEPVSTSIIQDQHQTHIHGIYRVENGVYLFGKRQLLPAQEYRGLVMFLSDNWLSNLEKLEVKSIRVFPNPASERIYVEFNDSFVSDDVQIRIYDQSGRLVHSLLNVQHSEKQMRLDISDLSSGVYSLQVISARGWLTSGKFVKR